MPLYLKIMFEISVSLITSTIICYAICANISAEKNIRRKFILFQLIISSLLVYISSYVYTKLSVYTFLMQIIVFVILGLIFFKNKIKEYLLSLVITMLGVAIIETLVGALYANLINNELTRSNIYTSEAWLITCLMTILWVFISMIVFVFIYYIWNYFKKRNVNKYLPFIVAFPITQMISLLYIYNVISHIENNNKYFIGVSIIGFSFIIADIVLFFILKYLFEKDILKQKTIIMEKALKLEKENYDRIINDIDKINKIKHDFKNQLQSILLLIEKGKDKDAKILLKELNNKTDDKKERFCNNTLVDVLLKEKEKDCKEKGIKLLTEISLKDNVKISKLDLCSIFSNIMDNAINATKDIPDSYINIKVKTSKGYLIIIENNNRVLNNIKIRKNNSLIKNHGIGLLILKDICDKYNGELVIKEKEKEYEITIYLKVI